MQPRAHRGHYIAKNLRVPMRPEGPNINARVPVQSPDLRENHAFSPDLRVQLRSQKPSGSNYNIRIYQRISGFLYRLWASVIILGSKGTSGSQIRSQDTRRTSGLLHVISEFMAHLPRDYYLTYGKRDHRQGATSTGE